MSCLVNEMYQQQKFTNGLPSIRLYNLGNLKKKEMSVIIDLNIFDNECHNLKKQK